MNFFNIGVASPWSYGGLALLPIARGAEHDLCLPDPHLPFQSKESFICTFSTISYK